MMRKQAVAANGLVLSAVVIGSLFGSTTAPRPLVDGAAELAELEARTALAPSTHDLTELASAYVARAQPGLAQALLDRHADRPDVELTHARARVALARGDVDRAGDLARATRAACELRTAIAPCPAWVVAKNLQQLAVVEALESQGIHDLDDRPDASRAAIARASHTVQLVAMR
jgi:hypothetical protein